jgi:hypothetical protein
MQKYTIPRLIQSIESGERVKFIFFWSHTPKSSEPVGSFCLSQWFELPFVVDGISYKTAEHWMMAQKALLFGDEAAFQAIITAKTPAQAKEYGRMVEGFEEERWVAHRFEIVKQGNVHKFSQHPTFAQYLRRTGNRVLVEASPVDAIWGIGLPSDAEEIENPRTWKGLNLLGFALMEVRDKL